VYEEQRILARPDGTPIAYGITRAGTNREPVVLLHGLASNRTRWSEFVEHTTLAGRRDLIRLDLRGHGESQPPAHARHTVSLEAWTADIAAILDEERARAAILVGHSLGAQAALHFGGRLPERTLGLALIDPVFRSALKGRLAFHARFGPLFQAAAAVVRGLNRLGLTRTALVPLDLRELDRLARRALQSKQAEEEFVRQYSSTRADLKHIHLAVYLQDLIELFRPLPPLESIRQPVLLLMSAGATFADPQRTAQVIARFPRSQVVTIDCHHWPLTERPDEVRDAIERWCDQQFGVP
jgi:pimeloyl-ACP methyl ester carboxylesterase